MRRVLGYLLVILCLNLGISNYCYSSGLDGNVWIKVDSESKISFISGVLLSNQYICLHNTPLSFSDDSLLDFVYNNQNLIKEKWNKIKIVAYKKVPLYAYKIFSQMAESAISADGHLDFFIRFLYTKDDNFNKKIEIKFKAIKKAIKDDYDSLNLKDLKKDYEILSFAYLLGMKMRSEDVFLKRLKGYCLYNISPKQLVDGLDTFYKDFKNRNIKLGDAIYIVKRQIMGEDEETIRQIIKFLKTRDYKYYVDFPP